MNLRLQVILTGGFLPMFHFCIQPPPHPHIDTQDIGDNFGGHFHKWTHPLINIHEDTTVTTYEHNHSKHEAH